MMWQQWLAFALGSAALIGISWRVLRRPQSHGFYRFFAWEVMLALLVAFLLLPGVEPQLMVAGLLFASAPMMSIYPILGQRFGLEHHALVAARQAAGS